MTLICLWLVEVTMEPATDDTLAEDEGSFDCQAESVELAKTGMGNCIGRDLLFPAEGSIARSLSRDTDAVGMKHY